jgi:hypothetical protein
VSYYELDRTGIRLAIHRGMRALVVALLGLVTGLLPCPAATLEKLSLDELISKASSIVHARVSGSSAAYRGSVIYTVYQIQVVDRLKGSAQSTVQVLVPGGTVAGVRQSVSGAPRLAQGSQYLLFLWTAPSGATYIMGLTQGVFDLSTNATGDVMASRKASDETMLERGTLRVVQDEPLQMRLQDVTALVAATPQGAGK